MRVFLLLALAMQLLVLARPRAGARHGQVAIGQAAQRRPAAWRDCCSSTTAAPFPASAAALPAWTADLGQPAAAVAADRRRLLDGRQRPQRHAPEARWVFYPNNTMVDLAESRLLGADGSTQHVPPAIRRTHDYMLHYGSDVHARSRSGDYQLVMRFSSPYFVRAPVFSVLPQAEFRTLVAQRERPDHRFARRAGGAGDRQPLHFFVHPQPRQPVLLAVPASTYALAWALPFNVLADLFDWHKFELHYVPFFLLPVFSTLFYLHFLRLKEVAPRLAEHQPHQHRAAAAAAADLLLRGRPGPQAGDAGAARSGWCWPWCAGIVAWRRGFQPARYFVFAFIARDGAGAAGGAGQSRAAAGAATSTCRS